MSQAGVHPSRPSVSRGTPAFDPTPFSNLKRQNYRSFGFSNCFPQLLLEKSETKNHGSMKTNNIPLKSLLKMQNNCSFGFSNCFPQLLREKSETKYHCFTFASNNCRKYLEKPNEQLFCIFKLENGGRKQANGRGAFKNHVDKMRWVGGRPNVHVTK